MTQRAPSLPAGNGHAANHSRKNFLEGAGGMTWILRMPEGYSLSFEMRYSFVVLAFTSVTPG
jgi:hypothetical protein